MRCLVLVGLVGCASPDAPPFKTGGISVEGNRVYFTHSVMDFGVTSVVMPKSYVVDGMEMLHPRGGCGEPALVGVGLLPAVDAIAEVPDGMTSSMDVVWRGPVAARLRVTYSAPYQCGGTSSSVRATSTFTFFENDRIVRVDEGLEPNTSGQVLAGPQSCGCASTEPYRFASHWALAGTDVYDKAYAKRPVTDAPACIPIGTTMLGARYTSAGMVADSTRGYALVSDQFGVDQPNMWPASVPAIDRSVSEIVAVPRGTDDPQACATAARILEDYPPIVLNGNEIVMPDEAGIYIATRQYTGTLTITTNARDIPSTFVLDVNMGNTKHLKVTDDFGDTQYNVQALDGGRLLLSLPPIDRMQRGRVTIEPLD